MDRRELEAAKAGRTISVVLPALNEEETVASVVDTISPLLGGLVDELIVLDSGSTDDTEIRAIAAGARVVSREQALPEVPPQPGKGEVLWRSLAATTGDLVVFVDSDLIDPDPMFVPRLVGPLLTRDGVHLVKGFYRRPLKVSGGEDANGGGRVTELVARPLLAALRPELGGVLQPLGGEYAATRELLTSVPFAPGYGVEIGLLIDTYDRLGLDAIAQVNLGVRAHRNRPLTELGAMSRQVIATLLSPLRRARLRDRPDPVLRRRRRLHRAHVDGVAGRPAADEHPALTRPAFDLSVPIGQYRWRDAGSAVSGRADSGRGRAVRRRPACSSGGVSGCRRCRGPPRPPCCRLGVTGADVDAVKFTQALRGYKTSEVDWVLDRLGQELDSAARCSWPRCVREEPRADGADRRTTRPPRRNVRLHTSADGRGATAAGPIDEHARRARSTATITTASGAGRCAARTPLFERMRLEAFQSGLSWLIILRKRDNFRRAFDGFDIENVARYTDARRRTADGRRRASCATAPRSRRPSPTPGPPPTSTPTCPTCCGRSRPPPRPRPAACADVPAVTPESTAMARELKRRGFRFVGPTTAYALMQATGMVDDHIAACWVPAD